MPTSAEVGEGVRIDAIMHLLKRKKKKSVVAVCGVFTDIVHQVQLYSNATSNFVFNNSYRNHAASTRFPRRDQGLSGSAHLLFTLTKYYKT